ncbi:MAG: hypothetical protein ONB46_11270 [candidate division KSB1 bacterium]|nr:hypothetical protein [candidate division KSB1 bacterium]MDZ7366333.1 hypothetical protein [candidate division KSB1 bacterium]MDZ7403988.1 hypothetical protein [candidate division KSB1 bacterium]
MRDDLKIAEIRKKYEGKRVMVEITRVDKYNNPLRGRVLFHGANRDEVYGQGPKYRKAHPTRKLFYFYAGDPIPHGGGLLFVSR